MDIDYDENKRSLILDDRGLDIGRSGEVFDGFHLTRRDDRRRTMSEERFQTVGALDEDVVIVTWTIRGPVRRIVTMWKANGRERDIYYRHLERPG